MEQRLPWESRQGLAGAIICVQMRPDEQINVRASARAVGRSEWHHYDITGSRLTLDELESLILVCYAQALERALRAPDTYLR